MESQMHRPSEQEHPQHVASDNEMVEDQAEHGEKKSMLKKVKDKAKKIKGTIKKHGLGQDQEDEEIKTNPAVHGPPPGRVPPVITGTNPPPMQGGFNLEKPTDTREDRYDHHSDNVKGGGGEYTSLREKGVTSPPQDMETEFNFPKPEKNEPEMKNITKPDVKTETSDITPSDYQTRDVDSTGQGVKEADVGSLTQGLKKVSVGDESKPLPGEEQPPSYSGSHGQFAPQSTPTKESLLPQSHPLPQDEPKRYDPNHPDSMPQDTITGKISSASAVIVDKAATAKNVVASKLGYGGQTQESSDGGAQQKKPLTETAAEYKNMVAEKVSGAGAAVMSKVRGSGTGEQAQGGGGGDEASKGVSTKDYLSDKLKPGEEDKALSKAITEKLQVGKNEPRDGSKAANESSPGGVVSSLKGVVGSWLGKNNGSEEAAAAREEANAERKVEQ